MPMTQPPPVEVQATCRVFVSPADLRLLQACVSWLLQVQRDPNIQQRLATLGLQLEKARSTRACADQQHRVRNR